MKKNNNKIEVTKNYFNQSAINIEEVEKITQDIIVIKYNNTDKSYHNILLNPLTLEMETFSIKPISEIKDYIESLNLTEKETLYRQNKQDFLTLYTTCDILDNLSLLNNKIVMSYPSNGMRAVLNHISPITDDRKDGYEAFSKSLEKVNSITFVQLSEVMEASITKHLWENNLSMDNQKPENNRPPKEIRKFIK